MSNEHCARRGVPARIGGMSKDLFEHAAAERMRKEAPLARRVAPRTLDELAGIYIGRWFRFTDM